MTIQDYDGVLHLWLATLGMGLNNLDDSREGIKTYLARNPDTCFVAMKAECVIGSILSGHDGRRGYIYHMAVAVIERNHGTGIALLDAALAALGNAGITKVALVVFSHNISGNSFWEKRGFTQRGDIVYRNRAIRNFVQTDT